MWALYTDDLNILDTKMWSVIVCIFLSGGSRYACVGAMFVPFVDGCKLINGKGQKHQSIVIVHTGEFYVSFKRQLFYAKKITFYKMFKGFYYKKSFKSDYAMYSQLSGAKDCHEQHIIKTGCCIYHEKTEN